MQSQGSVTAAVVQAAPIGFDPAATLVKAKDLLRDAAGKGAQLVVFPEAFLSAYPRGLDFGAAVGSRSDEGREWFRRYWESAIEVPGPETDDLAALATQLGSNLVMGAIEREGGTLYCALLYFTPEAGLIGCHRKLMPTGSERLIWGCGDGSTLRVYKTTVGNLGGAICWENYMPLLRTSLYQQHVQIWCAPTADARDSWTASMRHIAVEGRCFVLSANQYAQRSDYPDDYAAYGDDPNTVVTRGGSCIVDPFGNLLAGPEYGSETTLFAQIDIADTVRGKFDLDVVGHYARPDVFTLHVNAAPGMPEDEPEV